MKFSDELTAIAKLIKSMQEIVQSGDAKKVLQNFLSGFLQALEIVTKVIKDKKYTHSTLEFFRKLIIAEIEKNGA